MIKMKIFKITSYIFINILFIQFVSFCLEYFYMYINGFFIPSHYRWSKITGRLREDLSMWAVQQFMITNIEIILFVLAVYAFNKWFLKKTFQIQRYKMAIWTSVICYIII